MHEIKITITKEDLDSAPYCSNKDCPIARSLIRNGMKNVRVSGFGEMTFENPNLNPNNIYRASDYELAQKVLHMTKNGKVFFDHIHNENSETFTHILKYQ